MLAFQACTSLFVRPAALHASILPTPIHLSVSGSVWQLLISLRARVDPIMLWFVSHKLYSKTSIVTARVARSLPLNQVLAVVSVV
jgi:hypothetical protein